MKKVKHRWKHYEELTFIFYMSIVMYRNKFVLNYNCKIYYYTRLKKNYKKSLLITYLSKRIITNTNLRNLQWRKHSHYILLFFYFIMNFKMAKNYLPLHVESHWYISAWDNYTRGKSHNNLIKIKILRTKRKYKKKISKCNFFIFIHLAYRKTLQASGVLYKK